MDVPKDGRRRVVDVSPGTSGAYFVDEDGNSADASKWSVPETKRPRPLTEGVQARVDASTAEALRERVRATQVDDAAEAAYKAQAERAARAARSARVEHDARQATREVRTERDPYMPKKHSLWRTRVHECADAVVDEALLLTGNNVSAAARYLEISRETLYEVLRRRPR